MSRNGNLKSVFLFLFIFSISCCFAQTQSRNWYSIKAFVPEWKGSPVELKVNGKTVFVDTLREDMFSYVDTITGVHEGLLQFKRGNSYVTLPLFIEPGTIKVIDKGGNQLLAMGSPTNEAWNHLINRVTTTALRQYSFEYEKVNQYKAQLFSDYIRQNRSSPLSLHLLQYYPFLTKSDDPLYTELYDSLDPAIKNSFLGKQLGSRLHEPMKIGKILWNLRLPDSVGQLTPMYSQAKLTLIDFWASWCKPCREINAELVDLHNKFSSMGLSIVSVSIDKQKTAWLNAVKKDGLKWNQLSELKGWESAYLHSLGIKQIPFNILVDDQGRIIGINLGMDDLRKRVPGILRKGNLL